MPGPLSPEPSGAVDPAARDRVVAELAELLTEVIGEDYLLDTEIGPDTTFNEDLEVESIEFVALSERLLERYGDQVDFVGWLAGMELDDIIALTVGQVADFVVASTATSSAG